ncbi:MAG TPA: amidohydrolase [Lacipirellulaceae bacterium]|nr:amidohydrolase [Lacipirellulaceae bacterium]
MTADWRSRIDAAVDDAQERIVALRRQMHSHPEPSGEELQTSLRLYQLFDEIGLGVRMGPEGCGVMVDSRNSNAARRIALRADIDALRIEDQKQAHYRSTVPQVMHACGHDAHTATVYGALVALDRSECDRALPWPVTWRGIFQPAEETSYGARSMVDAGALEGVSAILSMHVDPMRRAGTIGVRSGVLTASCDAMRVVVRGRGGHAARPHESNDPIAAAAELISTLYQFVPRATDSQDAVVVSFGQIHGGQNSNVIPEEVVLEGTVRTLNPGVRAKTIRHIRTLAQGIEQVTGTKLGLIFDHGCGSVCNDDELTKLVTKIASDLLGSEQVELILRPSMGSEDFAAYLEHVPGTMFRLGAAGDDPPWPGLHTPTFDVDERCLAVGAKILARSVVEWSKPSET